MRRLILAIVFFALASGAAHAACPTVLTDCPNLNANNALIGTRLGIGTSTPSASNAVDIGNGTGNIGIRINAGNTNANDGGCIQVAGAGTVTTYFGNKSACAGGAFSASGYVNNNAGELDLSVYGGSYISLINFGSPMIQLGQHIITVAAAAPALTACGTGPAVVGTDSAGVVTMGTTATGCVITFAVAYGSAPFCTVTWQATPLASQSYTVTNAAITTVQTSTSSNKLVYQCLGRAGG